MVKMSKIEIIPAIDLKGGKCVRLYQGDYSRETVFSDDPVEVARHWQSLGAQRLHIVDLDGAAKGKLQHSSIIESIAHSVHIPLQLGGGLRSLEAISQALDLGVARVIIGTAAIEDQTLVQEACRRFGNLIIVGIDARDGYVATRGWQEGTTITAIELAWRMAHTGVGRFVYTDIARDGTLTEPNFDAIAELVKQTDVPVIAAGGISSVEHLERLSQIGVDGAVVGRALYTGNIDLKQALETV
jgi:phosphoribosylformimino-5-aminoimidazole carboxamide ribotide isomerase